MSGPVNSNKPNFPFDNDKLRSTFNSWKKTIYQATSNQTSKVVQGANKVGEAAKEQFNSGKEKINTVSKMGHRTVRTMKFGIYGMIGIGSCFAVGYLLNSISRFYQVVSKENVPTERPKN